MTGPVHAADIHLQSEDDTARLGRELAHALPGGTVVALNGTLGSGKTRLVRAVAEACGVPARDVTSPTFTLWQTYRGSKTIHHLDAYRIRDDDEFMELGVEECFDEDALIFIEWAERVADCLPPDHLEIQIDVEGHTSRRVKMVTTSSQLVAAVSRCRVEQHGT